MGPSPSRGLLKPNRADRFVIVAGGLMATILLLATGASAQPGDDFAPYDPRKAAVEQTRQEIEQSTYRCVKAVAWGDIVSGVHKRSAIKNDLRLFECKNILAPQFFSGREIPVIFERIVDSTVEELIAHGP